MLEEPFIATLRGEQFLESGYIFAPYIPKFETPEPVEDFRSEHSIMSRYAEKTVNNRFYGTISVNELNGTE